MSEMIAQGFYHSSIVFRPLKQNAPNNYQIISKQRNGASYVTHYIPGSN